MWSYWLVFCDCGFSLSAFWCPLSPLLEFLLLWTWGISSQSLAAPVPHIYTYIYIYIYIYIYAVYEIPTSDPGTHTDWKWEDVEGSPCKWNRKKAEVVTFISGKTDFQRKTVVRDKEGYYIMIKESIQEEDIIVNIHTPNTGAPQCIRQMQTAIK